MTPQYLQQQYQVKIGALMAAYASGDREMVGLMERSVAHLEVLIALAEERQ